MMKTSTQTDVVKYLYEEATENEQAAIQTAIITNSELGAFYYEMKALKRELSSLKTYPPKRIISNILCYSRSVNAQAVCN